MNYEKYFDPLNAVHAADFNRCVYCGCESSVSDYIPPIKFIHDWRDGNTQAEFISVPSCTECYTLLKNHNSGTLDDRTNVLKSMLAEKYSKAIRVFNHWSPEEIAEMDLAFQISLNGGVSLGKEALSRIRFSGFDYEINGSITRVAKAEKRLFTVFDEAFEDFKTALEYACSTYKIKKSRLSQLYYDNGESFEKAVTAFHRLVEMQRHENEIKKPCDEFAERYSQNPSYVFRMVSRWMAANEDLTVGEALDKLFRERISLL